MVKNIPDKGDRTSGLWPGIIFLLMAMIAPFIAPIFSEGIIQGSIIAISISLELIGLMLIVVHFWERKG